MIDDYRNYTISQVGLFRGSYHFIKFNIVDKLTSLAEKTYQAAKYINENNTYIGLNELMRCANNALFFANEINNITPKGQATVNVYKNRYLIGEAIQYAIYESVYLALKDFYLYPMENNYRENVPYNFDTLRIDTHKLKGKYYMIETPSIEVTSNPKKSEFLLYFPFFLGNDLSGKINLNTFHPSQIFKKIFDYLEVSAQNGKPCAGAELFAYYAEKLKDKKISAGNFSYFSGIYSQEHRNEINYLLEKDFERENDGGSFDNEDNCADIVDDWVREACYSKSNMNGGFDEYQDPRERELRQKYEYLELGVLGNPTVFWYMDEPVFGREIEQAMKRYLTKVVDLTFRTPAEQEKLNQQHAKTAHILK